MFSCMPKPGHAGLRKGRYSEVGRLYLLTTVTHERRPSFLNWEAARQDSSAMQDPAIWRDSRLLCWVLMPDHWHGLLMLGEGDDLPNCMRRFKGRLARELGRAYVRAGPLWAPSYHDHALRRDEDVQAVARYVIANPVRAGLVTRVGLYPFWDAAWI
jgi:putative transposase